MSVWLRSGTIVLTKVHAPTKLRVSLVGPYTIEHVQVNGNLTILLREGITECINICRVLPYCWPFHIPLWRWFSAWIVLEIFTIFLCSFFLHLTFEWVVSGVFWIQFMFVHLWQRESCQGGEECHAHGNNLYGYGGWSIKNGTLSSPWYIYSNPFRFLISSLGLPIFFLRIDERERWQNMPPRQHIEQIKEL